MKILALTIGLVLCVACIALAQSPRIGPSFGDELKAAGLLGLPFSWRASDGALRLDDPALTNAQRIAIQGVLAAHDPTKLSAAQITANAKATAITNLTTACTNILASSTASADVKSLCAILPAALGP